MGLLKMAFRRFRKIIAWVMAVVMLAIGIAGVWWLLNQAGMQGVTF
jgi:hypothetical protein